MDPVGKRYENKGKNDHANKNNDTPWFEFVSGVALFAETVIKKKKEKRRDKNGEGVEERD